VEIIKIKETCLYTNDLELAKAFYHGKLGLPVIGIVKNRHVFFRAGGSVLLCFNPESTINDDKVPPHYAHGNQHLAFEVKPSQYQNWKNKLKELGILITHEHTWPNGKKSFYFNDPENNVLEIIEEGMWETS